MLLLLVLLLETTIAVLFFAYTDKVWTGHMAWVGTGQVDSSPLGAWLPRWG